MMPKVEFVNLRPEEQPVPFRPSRLECRNGKWLEIRPNGAVRSASGRYDFVTKGATIYIVKVRQVEGKPQYGHIDLAQGHNVHYAGQVQFSGRRNRGRLRWWSNGSGHYLPTSEAAQQAGLPLELFRVEVSDLSPQSGLPVGSVRR